MSREVERRKTHVFDGLDDVFPQPADPRSSRDEFSRALAVLVSAFPGRPLLPATAELYYRALAQHERADLIAGVREAVTSCEQWPAMATLRRLCDEARTRRRERDGLANVPGQEVSADRAALIAELHDAEAAVQATAQGAATHPKACHHALKRHAQAVAAITRRM